MPTPRNTPERLRATWSDRYVERNGCHEWAGYTQHSGHGQVRVCGHTAYAHRVAYELFVGPIPPGLLIRHRCDNPCCVNPDHLEVGTHADNAQDAIERSPIPYGRPRSLTGPLWPVFLKRLNQLGLSHARLAEKFGVSRPTITRTIQRAPKSKAENTRRERNGSQTLPGKDWPIFLRKLNQLGLSQRRLATKFGVSPQTIRRTINRNHPKT